MEDVLGKWLDTVSSGSWRSMCTDFWEKEKKQSQSGFIFRFSSGIVFLSVFRTDDYEMYRKNRVLAVINSFEISCFYHSGPRSSNNSCQNQHQDHLHDPVATSSDKLCKTACDQRNRR